MNAIIRDISQHVGDTVTIAGWLHNRRSSGKIHFLTLRDGTGFIQAVMSKAAVGDEEFRRADHLSQETSLSVTGTVRADARAKGGFELDAQSFQVHGEAHDYPITPKEHGVDYLMDRRHLWIRSERQAAILRVRHEVVNAIRDFFNGRGFILCDTPIFTPAACEGTTTLFPVEYFDDGTAYLTQSGQLYNEANAMALGKVYCFGPTFRAEKSKTRRHLTEFWMVEPEMAYADLNDVIDLAEGLVVYVVGRVLDARKQELKLLERDTTLLEKVTAPFPRMRYDAAAALLQEKGLPFQYGTDLGGTDETVLSEQFDKPLCVTHYPAAVKAFYMKPDPDQPDKALCVDVLAPEGYGEIIGGGQRLDDFDLLQQRIREHGLPESAFDWYLDLRRYGTVPHGGFGMGVERCVAWLCKLEHVRETIPYPRMLYRLYPLEGSAPLLAPPLYHMKIGMISLGCPKNLVDSEVMLGLARDAGHELTRDATDADVLVVNTCAFIDKAKQESIDTILEMAEHKKDGRCRQLVVTGCLAERYRDELREQIPEIDAVLGTGEVDQILAALGTQAAGPAPSRFVPLLRADGQPIAIQTRAERPTYLYGADTPRMLATPRHYSYLKIAEGCDYKCAFCIIPTLRGAYRSRTQESILSEARSLATAGTRELLLISQDTSFYGNDRGERGGLARLLRELDRVDGLEWIRMLYLYPTTVGDDVLDAIGESSKVCRYIDLPLQHAADPVLKRMRRPGTRASYARLLDRIRRRLPNVTLRTTFIVGFPGETEADVQELQEFITEMQFDHVGVFTYSHEEGTSGYALQDDVPAAEKNKRRSSLMSLQRRIVAKAHRARIGQQVRLLVDGPSSEHELVLRARGEGQAPDIDSCVYLTEIDPSSVSPGSFLTAEIVASKGYDLLARPLVDTNPA